MQILLIQVSCISSFQNCLSHIHIKHKTILEAGTRQEYPGQKP